MMTMIDDVQSSKFEKDVLGSSIEDVFANELMSVTKLSMLRNAILMAWLTTVRAQSKNLKTTYFLKRVDQHIHNGRAWKSCRKFQMVRPRDFLRAPHFLKAFSRKKRFCVVEQSIKSLAGSRVNNQSKQISLA